MVRRNRGLLITFSGLDGAGKSTLARKFIDELRRRSHDPIYIWSRGGYTPGMDRLKSWLRRAAPQSLPAPGQSRRRTALLGRTWLRRLWLRLAIMDLSWLYACRLRWARMRGRWVVCDRYLWDTAIDFTLHFPEDDVLKWRMWGWLVRLAPRPDIPFLVTVPLEEAEVRLAAKREPFPQDGATLQRRHALYVQLAEEPFSGVILDGELPVDEAARLVRQTLARALEALAR